MLVTPAPRVQGTGRTVGEWLRTREPAPEVLARRLEEVLEARGALDAPEAPEPLLAAAEALLGGMLRAGCATRASALDLLVCDALVTYAFEAAADEPERLDALTRAAMMRIGALARGAGGA